MTGNMEDQFTVTRGQLVDFCSTSDSAGRWQMYDEITKKEN